MEKKLDKELYPDYVYPEHKQEHKGPARESILKLGKMITDRIPQKLGIQKITQDDPEYWGLAGVLTDEEAEIALKMGVRKPKTLKELVKLTGIPGKELEPKLQEMSVKGILEYNWENPRREKQYMLPMYVPGSAEFFNMNRNVMEEHPEVTLFFEHMSRLPLEHVTPFVGEGGNGIGMHVIPVEKAIAMESESINLEHISYWLAKYEGKYAASPCSCRRSRLYHDEGCGDDPEGWCIAVGDMADYVVETQKDGYYITKQEALDIFKQAEDNGFVHQITNIDGANKIFAICNCNVNVCYALRTSQLFNTPNMSRSAYVAKVDKAKCVACGKCVEACPAGAVKLGQKLCKKDGSEVTYPKMPLPQEQKWGEHMWTHNYRDVNRINCYDTGTAPCKTACPAHIAIQGYLKLAKEGNYEEALALIKKDNPLPAICGRICNRRCEDACTRGDVDEPIAIDEIKKFIAQQELDKDRRFLPTKRHDYSDKKIAIVGAGPAGLSCAYYLALDGYTITVFEKEQKLGGMLTMGIPAFRLEKDVVAAEIEIIREMGVEFRTGVEVGRDVTLDELRSQGYKAFYLAPGAQGGRKVGIEGEDAQGVLSGIEFLRNLNQDETRRVSGKVVVAGGGNVAIDVSRTAVRAGAETVQQFCLESRQEMPAAEEEIIEAEEEHIVIQNGWGPKRILVENGKVKGVEFKKCISVFDENHRFSPKYDENDVMTVEADYVLLSVGQSIQWGGLLEGSKAEIKANGAIIADDFTYQTGQEDIFAGGDAYTGPRFAIDAIAAGKQGAISIHRFVQNGQSLVYGRDRRIYKELNKEAAVIEDFDNTPRQRPNTIRSEKKAEESFRDLRGTFTEEQMRRETERCLGCGATVVDEYMCVGCGQCTTKCKFDAIHLERVYDGEGVKFLDMKPVVVKQMVKRQGKIAAKKVKSLFGGKN